MNSTAQMTVALISDLFYDNNPGQRLRDRLAQAKDAGAELAVLPELPVHAWSPATQHLRDDDAETLDGPRTAMQCEAAAAVGIGLVGGSIIRDEVTGKRYNTALIIDSAGELVRTYQKMHIPEEPGFWESSHYEPGTEPPRVIDGFGMPFGVQICSDINRPEGSHILAAQGAQAIFAPRSTELATYHRWRVVFQANAMTACAWVLSVNRPEPEQEVLIGGPSIAVDPHGRIVLETTDRVGVVRIDSGAIAEAKVAYPGYLSVRADMYAAAWGEIAEKAGREQLVGG